MRVGARRQGAVHEPSIVAVATERANPENDEYGNDEYGNDEYGNDEYGNDEYGDDELPIGDPHTATAGQARC